MSLPLTSRGESVPIVNSVRHRRFLRRADQYEGTQANMNQEYINVTRGIDVTRMFVEEQPFGTPDAWNAVKHTYFDGGKGDVRGAKYAAARAAYLRTHKNLWNYFRESSWNRQSWWDRDFWSNFAFCFDLWPELDVVNDVMWRSNRTHNALWNQQLQDIPNIGRSNEDYNSMNDVLQEIVDKKPTLGNSRPMTARSYEAKDTDELPLDIGSPKLTKEHKGELFRYSGMPRPVSEACFFPV